MATVLQAARLGVVGDLELQTAETSPASESADTERACPPTLAHALDALASDTELAEAVGPELVEHYLELERAEWQRFATAVTDWELDEYLAFQ